MNIIPITILLKITKTDTNTDYTDHRSSPRKKEAYNLGKAWIDTLGPSWCKVSKKSNNHSSQFHHWRLWKCITAKNVYAYPPPVSPLLSPSLFVFFMCAKLHYLYFAYCIANTLVTLFELCQSIFGYRLARMPGKNYIIFGSHDY